MKKSSYFPLLSSVLLAGWIAAPADLGAQPPRPKKEPAALKPATPGQIAFFEKNIRPVLVKECYSCHATTAEKFKKKSFEYAFAAASDGVAPSAIMPLL